MISPFVFVLLSLTVNINSQSIITSSYSGELAIGDGTYIRLGAATSGHYYDAIQIIADTTGTYEIRSVSTMDTHGFLYGNNTFYPLNASLNLIARDDDGGGNNQFKLTVNLVAGVPYILVISTHQPSVTGPYSINVTGPGNVQFAPINPMDLTTSTTTRPSIIISNYTSALTTNSQNFTRGQGAGAVFYYEAIEVRVGTTGTYTFKSSSAISDTYGYLYQGNFYPSYPTYNVVTQNDDGGGSRQFQLTATLRSDITYILVFTTYSQRATGSFSITASGPDDVYLTPITISQ